MKVNIQAGSLVVLSGPSGSGKSTVCRQAANDYHSSMILSSDALRDRFYGSRPTQEGVCPQAVDDRLIFSLMKDIARSRLKEGLTTFIDATMLTDRARGDFIKIAQKMDAPYLVLIFDISPEQLHQRNQARDKMIPEAVLENQISRHQKESQYPFQRGDRFEIAITPHQIPNDIQLDVIGDVHGMKQELDQLLASMGYEWADNQLRHSQHSKRAILFLGDLADRGYDSLGVLRLAMNAVSSGHYCLMGNHDFNLLRGLEKGEKPRSPTTQQTLHEILTQCNKQEIRAIQHFLKRLPPYYLHKGIAYVHADVEWFDPYLTPKRDLIRGFSKLHDPYDTDQVYQHLFEKGENRYQLVRGHIPPTGESHRQTNASVLALEAHQAFGGKLVGLNADNKQVEIDCSHYCYSPDRSLLEGLKDKYIKRKDEGYLTLYRYHPKVFYHQLWHTNPYLLMARGLVLGLGGHIVQRPFDKIFNYGENQTYPPLDRVITAVEKINGFLIAVTKHPYEEGLLYSTTDSLGGVHVDMGQQMSKPYYESLIQYLLNRNQTLLFEVIHPDDKHPIPSDNYGIYLLGCRDKESGYCFTETELDEMATNLDVPRPNHFDRTLREVLELSNDAKIEGYLIRHQDRYLCQVKTPYYLTVKFLSRLSDKKAKHLFNDPESFKENCDEQFYKAVDIIAAELSWEDYFHLNEMEKRDWLIQRLRRSVKS